MEFLLNIDLKKIPEGIRYTDRILLTGSCFTEHIGNSLKNLKFNVLQNPNGILFGPDSVCKSLNSYTQNKKYSDNDLFLLNELWQSWDHHSRFSHTSKEGALQLINESQETAHLFLQEADWVIITLGSSFSYYLKEGSEMPTSWVGQGVANCHRAPANWFSKEMLGIDTIKIMLEDCINRLSVFNPKLKFIFTVSPVRHIRDGVVENNRSKARLVEAVHSTVNKFEAAYYFPAYELVIDVLRDYRFYDIDLVHPNYAATEFVLEKFTETCMDDATKEIMKEIRSIVIARKHRAFQPDTHAHRQFLHTHLLKTEALQKKYPFLNLKEEQHYFSGK